MAATCIDDLPNEVLDSIFYRIIRSVDLVSLLGVCRRWREIMSHPRFWRYVHADYRLAALLGVAAPTSHIDVAYYSGKDALRKGLQRWWRVSKPGEREQFWRAVGRVARSLNVAVGFRSLDSPITWREIPFDCALSERLVKLTGPWRLIRAHLPRLTALEELTTGRDGDADDTVLLRDVLALSALTPKLRKLDVKVAEPVGETNPPSVETTTTEAPLSIRELDISLTEPIRDANMVVGTVLAYCPGLQSLRAHALNERVLFSSPGALKLKLRRLDMEGSECLPDGSPPHKHVRTLTLFFTHRHVAAQVLERTPNARQVTLFLSRGKHDVGRMLLSLPSHVYRVKVLSDYVQDVDDDHRTTGLERTHAKIERVLRDELGISLKQPPRWSGELGAATVENAAWRGRLKLTTGLSLWEGMHVSLELEVIRRARGD